MSERTFCFPNYIFTPQFNILSDKALKSSSHLVVFD